MDWKTVIFEVVGGLGLFLMGMKVMSESMQKIAGERLRKVLAFLTSNRFSALFVGFLVTAIIQSSSATTVMTVGFVNATLMTLQQAVGIILGANIGTTATGWIVTLKIVHYALPMIGCGVLLIFFSRREYWKYTGELIFGFGILFLGMTTMTTGFGPLKNSEDFLALFKLVDGSSYLSVLLGVFIGTATTVVVQSSSATIGIAIAMASQGLLNFDGAVSLILGDNIGTTITAILASIGTSRAAKRTAIAHSLFNIIGVTVVLIVFRPFTILVDSILPHDPDFIIKTAEQAKELGMSIGSKPYIGKHVALAHSLFNITNVILFLPFVNYLARLCEIIIPEKGKSDYEDFAFKHLNYTMIDTPQLALAEAENELNLMGKHVRDGLKMLSETIHLKGSELDKKFNELIVHEKKIDDYQLQISKFLLALSAKALNEDDANKLGNYLTMAHNFEKIGDFTENILKSLKKLDKNKIIISEIAEKDLISIIEHEVNYFQKSLAAPKKNISVKQFIEESFKESRMIKSLVKESKMKHFERCKEDLCSEDAGFHFIDILNNLRSMSSEIFNVSESVAGTKYDVI